MALTPALIGAVLVFVLVVVVLVGAHSQSSSASRLDEGEGYLCFIGASTGPVYVGISLKGAADELRKLREKDDRDLKVLGAYHVEDAQDADGRVHNCLARYHQGGQWYQRKPALDVMRAMR